MPIGDNRRHKATLLISEWRLSIPAMYRRSGASIDNTILRPYRSEPLEHKCLLCIQHVEGAKIFVVFKSYLSNPWSGDVGKISFTGFLNDVSFDNGKLF